MVIGTTRHCNFCGRVHFMGDARGPQWCDDDVSLVLGEPDPLESTRDPDGFSNLEGKSVPPPTVGIDEFFSGKKSRHKKRT